MPWDQPGSTAIVVLTPEADSLIGELYRLYAKAGTEGMTPHITLLVPFVPVSEMDDAVDGRLREVFGAFEPFDYLLPRFERFKSGTLYLAPEPSKPFVALTGALCEAFPDYPLYDGIHDDVVPHATVAQGDDDALFEGITSGLEPRLPVVCRAEVATIMERGTDLRWRPRVGVPLGG